MKKYALSLIVRHFPKVAPLRMQTLSRELLLDILKALADDMSEHDMSLTFEGASLN